MKLTITELKRLSPVLNFFRSFDTVMNPLSNPALEDRSCIKYALTYLIQFHLTNLTNWSNNIYMNNSVERSKELPALFTFIFYLVDTYYITIELVM